MTNAAVDVEFPASSEEEAEEEVRDERPEIGSLTPEDVPKEVRGAIDDLNKALAEDVPEKFPEDERYPDAEQPDAIAWVLIGAIHPHLDQASIAYLFRQSLNRNKSPIPAKATKTGPRSEKLSGHDFVIDVNWTLWVRADARERVRIMDEVLSFCGRDEDSGGYEYVTPEVITHLEPIGRWGVREGAQQRFVDTVRQLNLEL